MRVEKRDGSRERRILIGMVVDATVLARIANRWDGEPFKSRWSNLVGQWCIDFHAKYGEAPGKALEGIFEAWAEDQRDKETVQLIDRFLSSLSDEYEQLSKESNSDYLIDLAGTHFNQVRLIRLAEGIQGDLELGQPDNALKRVHGYSKIEMGAGGWVDVLQDESAIREAFESKREPIIEYPNALGEFFGTALERDGLVAFMAPEKRGKTFWLMDVAWRAMQQRRKVAFFAVGDMSQNQMMRRFMSRACRRPFGTKTYKYPLSIERGKGNPFAEVQLEERSHEEFMDWRDAHKVCQKTLLKARSKESLLRLACHPNSSISVAGITAALVGWEREGWTPDVVVIDYADILAPMAGQLESRDQINATWKGLRALSQSLHCLVVTATQSNAESYKVETQTRSNFSEDKRKLAHVTGMAAINQTSEEREQGLMRLNWVALREEEYYESRCVHVAGCLAAGNPAVRSCW